jgi:NAD(P)-dependent dehydrogenase (short-subunit alcohol dehydrogenase family)
MIEMETNTILIVGASRGLGRALAQVHLARGWHVLATVRDPVSLDDIAQQRLEPHALDITDWPGVDALRRRLDGRRIDTLFVNAAIVDDKRPIGGVEADVFTQLMVTNALAPLRLVERFVDLVPAGGMVAVMSSSLGSIALNDRGGWELYRMSKAALAMGFRSIAARRAGEGRTYIAADPGWVRTDMGGSDARLSIEESIPRLADMLEHRRGNGGIAFVNYENRELPW